MVITTSAPNRQEATVGSMVLRGVSWQTFMALLADVGEDRAWKIAYDRGVLELRMPLQEHEVPKIMVAKFVAALSEELEIEIMELGSLILEREDLTRAIEPDTCFYIQNEARVRGLQINLQNDPPPDLAVESDYTNSSVNKQSIYAALGVPEIWRYENNSLLVYRLENGKYEQCDRSGAFPFLPISEVPGFIEQSKTMGQRSAVRAFRERIREILGDRS
ncbi:MAG: Uma2 family endonuclease [Oscillatoriaceae cyanobacterium Prado104]|jgi:Uma2 family endonuclease|nr:Uma2 family endonuclease [Oscillatoriaceae cyanobacterium Prado104]